MKKLPYDPRFKHVDYRHTDLRTTFARERKRLADEAAQQAEQAKKVTPIKRKGN